MAPEVDFHTSLFAERIASYIATIKGNYLGHAECTAAMRDCIQRLAHTTGDRPLHMLDLGCGDGCTLRAMLPDAVAARLASYTGVDISSVMLTHHALAPGAPPPEVPPGLPSGRPAIGPGCAVSLLQTDLLTAVEGGALDKTLSAARNPTTGAALHTDTNDTVGSCPEHATQATGTGLGGPMGACGAAPMATYDLVIAALSVHHLTRDEKARLLAALRPRVAPGGMFVWCDVVRAQGESREDWCARMRHDIRTRYLLLTPDQREDVVNHMDASDMPEEADEAAVLGKAAGFSRVGDLCTSDYGFVKVFKLEP